MGNTQVELGQQIALVSGAGRGIGAAFAKGLAKAGAHVVCAARSKGEIDRTVQEIESFGGSATAKLCDVTDRARLSDVMLELDDNERGLDILIINAGIGSEGALIESSDPDKWRQVIEVNLLGAFNQAYCAIKSLQKGNGGKIVIVGSGMGRRPVAGNSSYAVSKAGLSMLTRALAVELKPHRIAVNEIIPGPVQTTFIGLPHEDMSSQADLERVQTRLPPGEWIKAPEDVVPLLMYVVSLPSDGPTGQTFSLMGRDL